MSFEHPIKPAVTIVYANAALIHFMLLNFTARSERHCKYIQRSPDDMSILFTELLLDHLQGHAQQVLRHFIETGLIARKMEYRMLMRQRLTWR